MLSHPSRQNSSGKLNLNSIGNDYDSDGDDGVSLYGTTRGGRGRGQATGARARGGRGSRSRGATPTRGRVSKNLNLVAAITSYGCRKTVGMKQGIYSEMSSGEICPIVLDRFPIL